MPPQSGDRLAILERRKNVAARYVRGEPQWSIARAFEVDQGTISRDLAAIRAEWLAAALRDFDALKAEQLAKVDAVEAAAWEGWRKSQENAETLRAEVNDGRQRSSKISKGQAGDPRFLVAVLKCVERRCAILGLDAEAGADEAAAVLTVRVVRDRNFFGNVERLPAGGAAPPGADPPPPGPDEGGGLRP